MQEKILRIWNSRRSGPCCSAYLTWICNGYVAESISFFKKNGWMIWSFCLLYGWFTHLLIYNTYTYTCIYTYSLYKIIRHWQKHIICVMKVWNDKYVRTEIFYDQLYILFHWHNPTVQQYRKQHTQSIATTTYHAHKTHSRTTSLYIQLTPSLIICFPFFFSLFLFYFYFIYILQRLHLLFSSLF